MATCDDLKALLELEVVPDIEEAIDLLFEKVADAKNVDERVKEEYAHLQELKSAFSELLHDLVAEEVSEEECNQIYEELVQMMEEESEEIE